MATKAELVEQLGKGKTKAEIAELEGMTKAELEEMSGTSSDQDAASPEKSDETVPGGKYIVDGRTVDADGKEIGKKK